MIRAEMKIAGRAVVIAGDGHTRLVVEIEGQRGLLLADADARAILVRCLESKTATRTDRADRVVFEDTDYYVSGMSTTSRATLSLRSGGEVEVTAESIENEINPSVGW